jgi:hypothetical protein
MGKGKAWCATDQIDKSELKIKARITLVSFYLIYLLENYFGQPTDCEAHPTK